MLKPGYKRFYSRKFKMNISEEIRRRDFLTLCTAGMLPGFIAACQSGVLAGGSATAITAKTATAQPVNPDWPALARSLQGSLILPGNPQYSTSLQLFDPRFDTVQPRAIAYCVSPADVQSCLAFARRFHLPFTPRAGGHSYAGY